MPNGGAKKNSAQQLQFVNIQIFILNHLKTILGNLIPFSHSLPQIFGIVLIQSELGSLLK